MSTAAALAPGSILAGFRIDSQIGRGGMGVVFRATQLSLERQVALKLISPELASEKRFRERFLYEARLAAAIDHPHLLPVYEAGESEGTLFLALRLVEGESLAGLLSHQGRLSPDRAVRLHTQLASALQAAHDAGLLHRDVKPHNVLLAGNGEAEHAYLCDFGLARLLQGGSLTDDRAFLGTAAYAAPEQIRGETLDARCDLYSLACVLYECLTGQPPFQAQNELAICWAHLHEPAPLPGESDPALASFDSLFARALAKDPEERFSSAAELAQAAQAAQAALAGAALGADSAEAAPAPSLPRAATSFLGREHELQEVLELLLDEDVRFLTLTGPGGTGKTRLALRAAEEATPAFPDGVYWVGLAALRDPSLVTETIAQTLESTQELSAHIADQRLLLLLDNFEQVVDAAPELASLLQACANLTLLVTSRELLRVRAEVEYPVPPLATAEGIELFSRRARLEPTEEIADLCSRLDNLPLAVELAAARTKALSPAQILERLSQRLDLLQGPRDIDPRQQTLRATIDWSYNLLGDDERRLLGDLSVFTGGCVLDAAERVCGAELDTLQSLVEKSLIRHGGERYWMLETIREYALELRQAGEREDTLSRRYAEYFVSLAQAAAPHLHDPERAHLLDELERELPNVRAALSWLLERDPTRALDLAGSLWEFWWIRGHVSEGRRWLDAAIAAAPDADQRARYTALSGAGILARTQGDTVALQRSLEQALELAREIGDMQVLADALNYLGGAYIGWLDDLERAQQVLQESLVLRREIGDDVGVMKILGNLGIVAEKQGELDVARSSYGEALALARELGSTVGQSIGLNHLALLLLDTDPGGARAMFSESLGIARSAHDMDLAWYALQGLAAAEAASGDATTAAVLLGAIDASLEQIGYALDDDERTRIEQATARGRESLGENAFAEAFARGRELTLDEAVDHGLGATEPH